MEHHSKHGQWSSQWAFIFATSSAAIGLGNIWKFPYITGVNGGGAFVLVYLICVAILGVPIMIAEIMIGRRARLNPANAMKQIAIQSKCRPQWGMVGGLTVLAAFLILSYYSVIAGWALDYVVQSIRGSFYLANAEVVSQLFNNLVSNPWRVTFWHTVMMLSIIVVVTLGVERGLERSMRYMLPSMFVLLLIVIFYAIHTGFFKEGFEFLFYLKFENLTSQGVLIALGHAFFTLSLATGSIMMYGAYVPRYVYIPFAAIMITLADTVTALMAGLAIFPIVFANGLEPSSGPGLIFQTLPLAFGHMSFGLFFASLFFIMVVFAGFLSAVSLLEPPVAWIIENYKLKRSKATLLVGVSTWLLGFGTIFSFNIASDFKLLGKNFFELLDHVTANFMLPIGGLLIALFAAWKMKKSFVIEEINHNQGIAYQLLYFILGYITPIAISIVLLNSIGLLAIF